MCALSEMISRLSQPFRPEHIQASRECAHGESSTPRPLTESARALSSGAPLTVSLALVLLGFFEQSWEVDHDAVAWRNSMEEVELLRRTSALCEVTKSRLPGRCAAGTRGNAGQIHFTLSLLHLYI